MTFTPEKAGGTPGAAERAQLVSSLFFSVSVAILGSCATVPVAGTTSTVLTTAYRPAADRLIAAALADSAAWNRAAALTDKFGHRLSGSRSLEDALDWIIAEMKRDGLENVRGEAVTVPHWVRGEESAVLVRPRAVTLSMIGLGGSIGTPPEGITAPVLVVSSYEDLAARASEAAGKIVLFDVPFTSYGATVRYGVRGSAGGAGIRGRGYAGEVSESGRGRQCCSTATAAVRQKATENGYAARYARPAGGYAHYTEKAMLRATRSPLIAATLQRELLCCGRSASRCLRCLLRARV